MGLLTQQPLPQRTGASSPTKLKLVAKILTVPVGTRAQETQGNRFLCWERFVEGANLESISE